MKNSTTIKRISAVVLLIQLFGCATAPEVENLTTPVGAKKFVLTGVNAIVSGTPEVQGGFRGSKHIGLLPGEYVATRENSYGTFYEGPNPAMWEEVDSWALSDKLFLRNGGIWIPHASNASPRLYSYPGSFQPVRPGGVFLKELPATNAGLNDLVIQQVTQLSNSSHTAGLNHGVAGPLGAGIAAGIVSAIADSANSTPMFISEGITDPELRTRIQTAVVAGTKIEKESGKTIVR